MYNKGLAWPFMSWRTSYKMVFNPVNYANACMPTTIVILSSLTMQIKSAVVISLDPFKTGTFVDIWHVDASSLRINIIDYMNLDIIILCETFLKIRK